MAHSSMKYSMLVNHYWYLETIFITRSKYYPTWISLVVIYCVNISFSWTIKYEVSVIQLGALRTLFLINLQAYILKSSALLKRDFNTGVFLWIFRNFLRTVFCEQSGVCFWVKFQINLHTTHICGRTFCL